MGTRENQGTKELLHHINKPHVNNCKSPKHEAPNPDPLDPTRIQ